MLYQIFMQKIIASTGLLTLGLLATAGSVQAQTIISGSNTTKQTLANQQTLTVTSNGKLSTTSGTLITVNGSSTAVNQQISITNSGSITDGTASGNTGGGRAIRDQSGGSNFIVTNNAGALIQSAANDTIAVNVNGSATTSASVVDIENSGTIQTLDTGGSGTTTPSVKGNQAINLTVTTGSNIVNNFSTGVIWSTAADAVRPGVNGVVHNDGLIFSNQVLDKSSGAITIATPLGTMTSSDGVDAQSDTGITIFNGYTTTTSGGSVAAFTGAIPTGAGGYTGSASDVAGKTQSTIEGGRHGITGGNTDPTVNNGAYTMTVTNNQGAKILGDNGSGINIDGINGNELVTITNAGLIQGNGHSSADGLEHDGDGVDVDGLVNLNNSGTIQSLNAYNPSGIEFSEGVTVGGGSITNSGKIEGSVAAGNTTAVGRGITLAGIDHDANDNDFPIQSVYTSSTYQNPTITNSGLIKGDTESGIAVLGTTNNGTTSTATVTITNTSTGTIEGKNTGVSEDTAITSGLYTGQLSGQSLNQAAIELDDTGNSYVINNSGTIQQDTTGTGTAVAMHGISNALNVTGGSAVIIGDVSGNTAANSTMTINPGAGNNFSYGYKISNFTVKINSDATSGIVTLSGASDYSGGTTISGGTAYIDNTTGSGTGTGSVLVGTGSSAAKLAGYGIIKTGNGSNGIKLGANGSLVSGDIRSGDTAGHGLTLDNSAAGGTILDASIPGANLTFYLGDASSATLGAGAGRVTIPETDSSYINVIGDTAGELKFAAAGDTITLNDLTGGHLDLVSSIPYLLIQATDNADYTGLVTTGDVGGKLNQNGIVLNIDLNSNFTAAYPGAELYLANGDLEVIPEPSTWALMFGGLGVLVLMQVRRRRGQA